MSGEFIPPRQCIKSPEACESAPREKKGRFFGHGRFFGIHNPLGDDIRKAADPHINLRTLSRLSGNGSEAVRRQAVRTLSIRLSTPGLHPGIFRLFCSEDIIEAVALSGGCSAGKEMSDFIRALAPKQLERIGRSGSPEILLIVYSAVNAGPDLRKEISGKLSREHLVRAVLACGTASYDGSNPAMEAYDALERPTSKGGAYRSKLGGGLSAEELEALSTSANQTVLERILKNPDAPPSALARSISSLTPRSIKVVDRPAEVIGVERETPQEVAAKGADPCYVSGEIYEIYSEEVSHMEYGPQDVLRAFSFLAELPQGGKAGALDSLASINPELHSAIQSQSTK